jgi:histidinol phosphatase-like enzyme
MVHKIRDTVTHRSHRRPDSLVGAADNGDRVEPSHDRVAVFLDLDTVLLATHRGKYGPELGLQADLPAAIDRLAEAAELIVVLVNPRSADATHSLVSEKRVAVLQNGLPARQLNHLVIATCSHGDGGTCDCAKPGHGLIQEHLASERDAHNGWYIGADQEGMVAGRGAGLHTIRIGPHGEDHLSTVHRPDYEARDLLDAANHIMLESLVAA